MTKYIRIGVLILALLISVTFGAPPKNVIILIGDGMGPEQVKAAGMYAHGNSGTLSFESLPFQADCTNYSANSSVTDSAAAATAIATGLKVKNGAISMVKGVELLTLLEYFKAEGKSTGLVTTTYLSHATPAAFGAHASNRDKHRDIVGDYLTQTRPNVLMGGTDYITPSDASDAGYTVVTNRSAMQSLNTSTVTYVSGQFGSDHMPYEYDGLGTLPHLSEMTTTALDILDNDPDGFFLMVEGGRIDHAGHDNDIYRNIGETIEFSDTVQLVLNWAAGRNNTLVIVTADHETGGLTVTQNNGQGVYPTVTWSTTGHTSANVPVYATGLNAEKVFGTMDNTGFFEICITDEMPADMDGDLDGDLDVDFDDLKLMRDLWLTDESSVDIAPVDAPDGIINLLDFVIVAENWHTAGMVAHWKLDEAQGTTAADSFSSLDGTVYGDAAWLPTGGQIDGALQFNGTDTYVGITGYKGVAGSTPRTCTAWVNATTTGTIMGWGAAFPGARWIIALDSEGYLRIEAGGNAIVGSTNVADGTWHHVAATSDGGNVANTVLYVDGNPDTPSYVGNQAINTQPTGDVTIGVSILGRYFNGLIDDVRIYDLVLSSQEIAEIAQ